jgi:hypothetical protein
MLAADIQFQFKGRTGLMALMSLELLGDLYPLSPISQLEDKGVLGLKGLEVAAGEPQENHLMEPL